MPAITKQAPSTVPYHCTENNPLSPTELVTLGDDANRRRNWSEAEKFYRAALAIDPNLSAIWIQLGHAIKEQSRLIEAQQSYERALEIIPQDADLHLQIGHCLKLQGRLKDARSAYSRALELNCLLFDAAQEISHIDNGKPDSSITYWKWIAEYDNISSIDRIKMKSKVESWDYKPFISIVMPTYNTPEKILRQTIDSVISQTYSHWELCIADDASRTPHVRNIIESYMIDDNRIKSVYRESTGGISEATNSAILLAHGDWIAFLDHDDLLAPHAMFCVADAIRRNPTCKLIYSDEDKIDELGRRSNPYFKCDWNPMLFLGHNIITHLSVYNKSILQQLGGLRSSFDGAQDYDLALRLIEIISDSDIVHIPHILYHWRMHSGSTALSSDEKPYAMIAGERALNEHFQRTGEAGCAHLLGFGYRIDFSIAEPVPLVTIIILTRNALELIQRCIDSVLKLTEYQNYEIIVVDNGSDDEASIDYLQSIARNGLVRVIRDDQPFNFSILNNNAVREARGSIICLLNNDIEVISSDWLRRMVALAVRQGTGAVGAKLLYPDETIQHAGVILGLGGLAAHAHWRFPRNALGYVARAALAQNFTAVTGACLVVKKQHYLAVGGMNETDLAVAYNDVDFCLKLESCGLRNVFTPFAELFHHESATRGYDTTPEKRARLEAEKAYMVRTWGSALYNDRAYSPNLTFDSADFALAFPPRVEKPWNID